MKEIKADIAELIKAFYNVGSYNPDTRKIHEYASFRVETGGSYTGLYYRGNCVAYRFNTWDAKQFKIESKNIEDKNRVVIMEVINAL